MVKTVVNMLSEGSQEVRNSAKLAVLTIRNNLSSQREFDGFMNRSGLTEKQIDQVRKIVEQGDSDAINNTASKIGSTMRGSSLDSRGAMKQGKNSDGLTQSSFNMANSFVSPTSSAANGFNVSDNSNATFKKRQASVSKPIDPQVYE